MSRRSNSSVAIAAHLIQVMVLTGRNGAHFTCFLVNANRTIFTDLLSSSVDGQWPQDQSLTRILLCINPDDRPVLWLVNFSFFLVTCSFRMSIDRVYFLSPPHADFIVRHPAVTFLFVFCVVLAKKNKKKQEKNTFVSCLGSL